jgi:ferrous iron transport protein B
VMNPVGGLSTVLASILLLFAVALWLGNFLSGICDPIFLSIHGWISTHSAGLMSNILLGLCDGLQAGAGIVIPYLLPLLLLLAIYEDTGLLPRIAFLVDGILHRFGLHGKVAMPIIMGYGCTVPALMATRNLDTPSDRFIARLLVPFIPCSARTVIILGLAGKYLGPLWVAGIYVGNIVVALGISSLISRMQRTTTSYGIVMEVPPLRPPYLGIALKKVWLRFHEFLLLGWPVIIISSIALSVVSSLGFDSPINAVFSPFTAFLRLPKALGITLFLGIFRKELAIIMLAAALGSRDIAAVLSTRQILTFVLFAVFYVPCIASLGTLFKEGGWKTTGLSAALNFFVALAVAGSVAWLFG